MLKHSGENVVSKLICKGKLRNFNRLSVANRLLLSLINRLSEICSNMFHWTRSISLIIYIG